MIFRWKEFEEIMHYIVTFTFFRELRGGDVEAVKAPFRRVRLV
jgi:hypothetical protein